MLVLLAGLVLVSSGDPSISVCNDMKVDLTAISFDQVAASAPGAVLHPGDCLTFAAPLTGNYILRFVEHSGQYAAQCARQVALVPGTKVSINPHDGSSCMQ